MLKRIFDIFVYSSLFIAVCCVLMCLLSFHLFGNGYPVDYLLFAFGGTVASYNFHWFLSHHKDVVAPRGNLDLKNLHLVFVVAGILIASYAFFRMPGQWEWLVSAAFFTFLYSAPMIPHPWFRWLKQIAVGKTAFLAFAWTHITVNIPMILSESDWRTEHYLFSLNRFFCIFSICILFDYRDRATDAREGIRSMVTELNEKGVDLLFWSSQLLVAVTGVLLFGRMNAIDVTILLLPSIALGVWYTYFKRSTSDFNYYFVLDGMMAVSALVILLLHAGSE